MRSALVTIAICVLTCFLTVQKTYALIPISLEKANVDVFDVKKIQKGAKHYAQYCLLCHAMKFMSHDPIANKGGITLEKMPLKNQKWWFGTAPPDLSLIAKVRSADWLYTYLHSFYKDPTRPVGSNNLLFDNTSMPNPFAGIQGEQSLIVNKESLFRELPFYFKPPHYYSVLELKTAGAMSSDEFDHMINELVTFLVYASEPKQLIRKKLGIWVMLFLLVTIVVVWLLKNDYWRSIKKKK